MQSRPCVIAGIVLVLDAGLALQTATAGPKEDVAAAEESGPRFLPTTIPTHPCPLYAKDGVLWGTLSPTVRSDGRAEGLFRRRVPGAAQGHRQVRRPVDPRVRRHRRQYWLLHVLLHQGRRNQIDPGPLQLHLREGRQRLEDR